MTVGLQITDETTTVDLNDGSYWEIIELSLGYGDVSAPTVQGFVRLYMDASKANMQTEIAALQKLLQAGVEYSGTSAGGAIYSSIDKPIYLNYRTDSTENYYRSQIYKASWSMPPDSLQALNFDCGGIEYIIDFERYNWWEGPEAQVQLSNITATNTTNIIEVFNPYVTLIATTISFEAATSKIKDSGNGLAVFRTGDTIWVSGSTSNNNRYIVATGGVAAELVVDGAGISDEAAGDKVYIYGETCNYVQIASSAITGDLPASTRIEITNNFDSNADYGVTYDLERIWVGQNFANPLTFENVLDSGSFPDSGMFVVIPNSVETVAFSWYLDQGLMSAAAGRYFKFIVGLKNLDIESSGLRFRLRLSYLGTVIWQTSQSELDSSTEYGIRDILTFALPPLLAGVTGLDRMWMDLTVYQENYANYTLKLDWAQIFPVDGFSMYTLSYPAAYANLVIDDGFTGNLYKQTVATKLPVVTRIGQPIMLQPGRTQRLYFIQHTDEEEHHYIGETLGIQLYYRPRRLSI